MPNTNLFDNVEMENLTSATFVDLVRDFINYAGKDVLAILQKVIDGEDIAKSD